MNELIDIQWVDILLVRWGPEIRFYNTIDFSKLIVQFSSEEGVFV